MDILDRMNELDLFDVWRMAYAEICLLRTQNEELRRKIEILENHVEDSQAHSSDLSSSP